ncbi:hypothetical protein [Amycolatopsis sp. cmx-4-54]
MAGLINRVKTFLQSSKGKALTEKARRAASDPRNRDRARDAAARFRRKR